MAQYCLFSSSIPSSHALGSREPVETCQGYRCAMPSLLLEVLVYGFFEDSSEVVFVRDGFPWVAWGVQVKPSSPSIVEAEKADSNFVKRMKCARHLNASHSLWWGSETERWASAGKLRSGMRTQVALQEALPGNTRVSSVVQARWGIAGVASAVARSSASFFQRFVWIGFN